MRASLANLACEHAVFTDACSHDRCPSIRFCLIHELLHEVDNVICWHVNKLLCSLARSSCAACSLTCHACAAVLRLHTRLAVRATQIIPPLPPWRGQCDCEVRDTGGPIAAIRVCLCGQEDSRIYTLRQISIALIHRGHQRHLCSGTRSLESRGLHAAMISSSFVCTNDADSTQHACAHAG